MGVRAVVTGVAVGLVVVTGCSGGPEQPAATVTPSTVPSTPMASSSPDPSQDPLYLEAVGVYTAYFKEMQKFEPAGLPTDELPKEMDKYIGGSLKSASEEANIKARRAHLRLRDGQSSTLTRVAPNFGVAREGSDVSIRVCVDGTKTQVVNTQTGEVLGSGAMLYKEVFFFREAGKLRALLGSAKVVESCPL